jgi:hypothetical protein
LSNAATNSNGIVESCVDPTIDEGGKWVVNIVTYFLVITVWPYILLLINLSICFIWQN